MKTALLFGGSHDRSELLFLQATKKIITAVTDTIVLVVKNIWLSMMLEVDNTPAQLRNDEVS